MGPLLLGASAMLATMYSTQAILPELGRAFDVSPAESGLTMTVLIVSLAVGIWFWASVSRRIGARRSLLLACGALVVPTLAAALVPSFESLLAVRAIQGLCMPGLLTVGVPYIAKIFGPRIGARAMGYYVASMILGGLVGRLAVAGLTAAAGWRVALGLLALLPLAATVVMMRSLPDVPELDEESPPEAQSSLRQLLRNRSLVAATVGGSCLTFGFNGTFSFVGYRLEEAPFSLSPAAASLVFSFWILGFVGPSAGWIGGRIGWNRVALGSILLAAVGIALSVASSLPLLCLGLMLLAIGQFCGITSTQLGIALSTVRDGGRANALYYSVFYVAGGLGGYVPGLAWQAWGWTGVSALALSAFALGFGALQTMSWSRGEREPRTAPATWRPAPQPSAEAA
jgi:MFS transporter, YNFM family, putative membrane transport protein